MSNVEIPDIVRQWKIGSGSANIRSWNNYQNNQGYSLFCQKNGKFLTWKEVPLGINLAFTGDASLKKTHFRLPDGSERDILSGESIAFGIGGGEAFLRYADRTVGINLKWSANPVFEWRIFGATSQTGTPIAENSLVAIVNDKVEPSPDFFIFLERPPGMADVGWTTSPQFMNETLNAIGNAIDKHKVEIAKAAVSLL